MKKIFLSLLCIFIFHQKIFSQAPAFEWVNVNELLSDSLFNVQGQNFVRHGWGMDTWTARTNEHFATTTNFGEVVLEEINNAGVVMANIYLGPDVYVIDYEITNDSGIVILANFYNMLYINGLDSLAANIPTANFNNYALFCIDGNNGTIRWKRNISATYSQNREPRALFERDNGEIYYAINDFIGDDYIKKINANGNDVDSIKIGGAVWISDFTIDNADQLHVTGATSGGEILQIGNISIPINESYAFFLGKMNLNGNGLWAHVFHDVTFHHPDLVVSNSGNAYIAGYLMDTTNIAGLHLEGAQWVYDFYLAKFDANGNVQWARETPDQSTITGDFNLSEYERLQIDAAENVTIYGTLRGNIDFGNNVHPQNANITDHRFLLLTYQTNGTPLWSKNFSSGNYPKITQDVLMFQGNYYVTAQTSDQNIYQFDTVQVNFEFQQNMMFAKLIPLSATGIFDEPYEQINVELYPNPANHILNIKVESSASPYFYQLTDALGKIILQGKCEGVQTQIDVANFPKGVYYFNLKTNEKLTTKKILIY